MAGAGARAAGSKTPSLVIHGAGARFAGIRVHEDERDHGAANSDRRDLGPVERQTDLIMQQASPVDPETGGRSSDAFERFGSLRSGIGIAEEVQNRWNNPTPDPAPRRNIK